MYGNTRTPPSTFLNAQNYQNIVGYLQQQYRNKYGSNVPPKMDDRLKKTVQHYMNEVASAHNGRPANTLTQEVIRVTSDSIDNWLKQQASNKPSVVKTLGAFPSVASITPAVSASTPIKYDNRLYEDTGTNYERMMADRTNVPTQQHVPNFAMPMDEPTEDPLLMMQRLQKQRDEQSKSLGIKETIKETESTQSNPLLHTNPTPPQATLPPPLLAPRPQDYIISQEDIVKYRETEYNIFITSADRDWLRNTAESRYNFTVNFNSGSKKHGYGYSPAIQERFRNIQRIEFIKAIVPLESLTTLVKVTSDSPSVVYDTTRVINVFSLPFASVRIAELNNNGFSTNPDEDNTCAIVQYDTTWSSDLVSQAVTNTAPAPVLCKSGYTGLIPKFLKTQRVYSPTPLATLQRLSIRFEKHNGNLFSNDSDVISIKRICMSGAFSAIGTDSTIYNVNDANVENSYIFLQTSQYFPHSAVSEGDTINIKGCEIVPETTTVDDFTNFINREDGHYVVAVGYVNNSGALVDGRNAAGYCNIIILRSRFDNPKTGSIARTASYFGGSLINENVLATDLNTPATIADFTSCALINISRQTHVVLRIIVRDMDSGSNIRPDNV